MQRQRADHGRRLSREDHVEIQRRVSEGETFARAGGSPDVRPNQSSGSWLEPAA